MGKAAGQKRLALRDGDLFELPLPDGRVGYGIVVRRGPGGAPFIAIFRSAYDHRPEAADVAKDEVAVAGWTTDSLLYHGQWVVIERGIPLPYVPFPNFKVGMEGTTYVVDFGGEIIDVASPREVELLDYQHSHTALIFQDAFEAMHGFGEWQHHFEKLTPAHAKARITRPPN
jgi:Immunity protein 26